MSTRQLLLSAVAVAFVAGAAQAVVLNWNAPGVDYPAGGVGPVLFNSVGGSSTNMTFAWSGNTNRFLSGYDYTGTGSPLVTLPDDDATPVAYPGVSALWYATNFLSTTESVSLTITFSQPVTNVSFHIYDIDGIIPASESTRIKGFLSGVPTLPSDFGGGTDVDIAVVPVDTDPATNDGIIFSSKGGGDTNPPLAANDGWVTFAGPIDMIGMQFRSSVGARGQFLSDITFVPEPATMILLAAGGLLALRRRAR
jgi:hypothetical protein